MRLRSFSRALNIEKRSSGAYAGMTDEFYVIHAGGKPFYNQRCPNCHVWTKGTAPSSRCSKCQAALPHHLHPLAQEAQAPGPEYGKISPDMTPESNLKSLERAAALTAPLSTEHAAQVYRMVNLIPLLWWLPMILAPNWRGTRALTTSRGLFAGLGLFYGAFLLKAVTEEGPPNYATYEEGPRRLYASHPGLLAGWAHYLAFDLFAGVWIWSGREEDDALTFALDLCRWSAWLALLSAPAWPSSAHPLSVRPVQNNEVSGPSLE